MKAQGDETFTSACSRNIGHPQGVRSKMLESALAYSRLGWRIMPLHNIENGICTCRPSPTRPKAGAACISPGKHPRIKTGRAFEAATVLLMGAGLLKAKAT